MKKNISLKEYTTFKIGGRAKYFISLSSNEKIEEAIKEIKKLNLPFFVLGGGSNVLISDKGYRGVVLKIDSKKIEIKKNKIKIDSGVLLVDLVKKAAEKSLTGLEWAFKIPGTVGGAIYGNAAAFGFSIKDNLENVTAFDFKKIKTIDIPLSKCGFQNKESIFKKNKNLIILSATFKLKKGNKKKIERKMKEYEEFRKKGHPLNMPSAGCTFKNYEGKIKDKKIIEKFKEIKEFNKKGMIPVSYLIDKSNLKGKKIGGAQVSEKHANFIVNFKKAKQNDVLNLVKLIKKEVYKKFKIKIEEEIQKITY